MEFSAHSQEIAGPRAPDRRRVSRSRVSNGSEFLPNIDGRSATARRMRDLVEDFKGHLGGNVSVAQEVIIRRCAALASLAEAQEAAHVTGEKVLDVPELYPHRECAASTGCRSRAGSGHEENTTPSLSDYLSHFTRSVPVDEPTVMVEEEIDIDATAETDAPVSDLPEEGVDWQSQDQEIESEVPEAEPPRPAT